MKDKLKEIIQACCSGKVVKSWSFMPGLIKAIMEWHEEEMQRVVDENERLRNGCRDDETRCPYYDLKDKVKQLEQQIKDLEEEVRKGQIQFIRAETLEQQIKESREVSVGDLSMFVRKAICDTGIRSTWEEECQIGEIIYSLIYGDKQGE